MQIDLTYFLKYKQYIIMREEPERLVLNVFLLILRAALPLWKNGICQKNWTV